MQELTGRKKIIFRDKVLRAVMKDAELGTRFVDRKDSLGSIQQHNRISKMENPDNFIAASLVQYKTGDINGDGAQDVAVIIEHHGMGSAAFYELSALLQNNGRYEQTKPVLLGDNIEIKDFKILSESNSWMPWSPQEISITMLQHKESDSHAKPTLEQTVCYYLENNELRDCKEQVIVKKPAMILRQKAF